MILQGLQKVLSASYIHPMEIFLLNWRPYSSFLALVRKVEGDPVLGLGSKEYAGPAHICARDRLRHLYY